MTYALWDKKTAIYDVTPEQAIINNPLYGSEDSYLFYKDDGSIHDILPISVIRGALGDTDGKTDSEICEMWIDVITQPAQEPSGDIAELTAKVADLEEQLAAAKILLGVD